MREDSSNLFYVFFLIIFIKNRITEYLFVFELNSLSISDLS